MLIHCSSMNIIVRLITGRIQDADNNSYDRVTIVYSVLAIASVVVAVLLAIAAWMTVDMGHLQWTRKVRIARGETLNERREVFYGKDGPRNRRISIASFCFLIALVLGSWCAYFWGVATRNN
jgi:hypothetical protein